MLPEIRMLSERKDASAIFFLQELKLVTIGTLVICAFFTTTEKNCPAFPIYGQTYLPNVCLYYAHKMYMAFLARKKANETKFYPEFRRKVVHDCNSAEFCKCAMYRFGSILKKTESHYMPIFLPKSLL